MSWDQPLTRPITLKKGAKRELVTLFDAAEWILENFSNVAQDAALSKAMADLMRAAGTGDPSDCATATDQVANIAATHGWV